MQNDVNDIDYENDTVVDVILSNPEIAKLQLGSEEQKAAINEKLIKTDDESEYDAPAGEVNNADDESDVDNNVDEEDEDADDIRPQVKKSKGVQKRIDELTREKADLKRQLEQYQRGDDTQQAQVESRDDSRPSPNDYDTTADYYEAIADWKYRQNDLVKEADVAQKKNVASWEEKAEKVIETYSDYKEVVNLDDVRATNPSIGARVYISKLQNGPAVLYNLLNDEALKEQFASADDIDQVAILAELNVRLSPKNKKATITNAPAPPKNLPKGKGSSGSKSIYDEDISDADFERLYEIERRKSLKR